MPSRDHRRHPGGQEGARRPDRWRARERAVLEGTVARPQAARAVHRTRACRRGVACLVKARDALLAFYDVPPSTGNTLWTTNPIESTFATIRHRTVRGKGC